MKKIYYIATENKFNQILIFTSKKAAEMWAKAATRWTPAEISKNIKESNFNKFSKFYSIF